MLSKSALKSKFIGIFNDVQNRVIQVPNPSIVPVPLIPSPIAIALANAYHEWATGASAGAMVPVGGNPSVIAGPLSSMPMMSGWGPGLIAYWLATPWVSVPPGTLAGVSIPAIMAKVPVDIASRILVPPYPGRSSKEDFADILADILFVNTKSLTVTQTVIQGGVTSVVTVS